MCCCCHSCTLSHGHGSAPKDHIPGTHGISSIDTSNISPTLQWRSARETPRPHAGDGSALCRSFICRSSVAGVSTQYSRRHNTRLCGMWAGSRMTASASRASRSRATSACFWDARPCISLPSTPTEYRSRSRRSAQVASAPRAPTHNFRFSNPLTAPPWAVRFLFTFQL